MFNLLWPWWSIDMEAPLPTFILSLPRYGIGWSMFEESLVRWWATLEWSSYEVVVGVWALVPANTIIAIALVF